MWRDIKNGHVRNPHTQWNAFVNVSGMHLVMYSDIQVYQVTGSTYKHTNTHIYMSASEWVVRLLIDHIYISNKQYYRNMCSRRWLQWSLLSMSHMIQKGGENP